MATTPCLGWKLLENDINTNSTVEAPSNEQLRQLVSSVAEQRNVSAGTVLTQQELLDHVQSSDECDPDQYVVKGWLHTDGLFQADRLRVPSTEDRTCSSSDYIGDSTESDSFDERPSTRANGCGPEPLDESYNQKESTEDYYRLHEPICNDPNVICDDRYLSENGDPMTAYQAIESYVERRHGESTSAQRYGFTKTRYHTARKRYAKGKAMDRQLLKEYENPTTVLLSLRLSPGDRSRLTLLDGLSGTMDPVINQLRYRLQEAPDAPLSPDEWEYFGVVAGTEKRATPHIHYLVYCDGDVSRDSFEHVVRTFVEKCPYAPDDMSGNSPDGDVISIRGTGDDSIPRMDDDPEESQGATYVLTQLPHLREVDSMAQDELLHSSTIDAWKGRAFRKSNYTVWDDEEPSPEEISTIGPT